MERYRCKVCGHIYDLAEGDQSLELLQEQLLRICRKIGYVQSVTRREAKFQLVVPEV